MNLALTAQLAQAAYGTLPNGITGAELARALQLPVTGFTPTQAQNFAATHTVVLQYNDDAPGSGGNGTSLSATVFKDKNGQLTLALRGTLEFGGDVTPTDRDILLDGAGYDQIAALYSWWMRASNPVGTLVAQYTVAPISAGDANALKLSEGRVLLRRADAEATGVLANALSADPERRIDVTGHSLGGHLAMAFNAMFGSRTSGAAVFNAPGFADTSVNRRFFDRLGGSSLPEGNKTSNVIANQAAARDVTGTGFTLIAGLNSRPGLPVDVPVEDQWLSDEPDPAEPARNHSQMLLADSLAVKALFDQIDPTFGFSSYRTAFTAASNTNSASLERLVDTLERLLLRQNEPLPSGNGQREALYASMRNLQASSAYGALSRKVLIESSTTALAAKGRIDFSSLASLLTLSPVVITASYEANQAVLDTVLQGTWGQTYAAWLADKALTTAQRTIGQATFSDQWLVDRSSMLATLVLRNQQDLTDEVFAGGGRTPMQYRDVAQGVNVQIGLNNPLGDKRQVLFGGDAADPLNGKSLADRLYGGAGMDELKGLDGNDYLEGNAGDDVLDGGRGNDVLVGGAGSDRFVVGFNHGFDSVMGADAGDRIELDGRFVTG
jgi:hypothetical protein